MKRFRTTYIIALILISIFVVVGELAVQLGLSTLSDDSRIINLSGRQRMLSQRITKNALILNQTSDYNEFQARKKELTEALANWRKAHEALQKGDITLGITKTANTKEITAKFNELQPIFDEMKEAASKITTYDFNSLDSATRAELNSNTQILVNNEVQFLPIMDEITFMYDKEAKSKTNTVGIITWAVGVSIIGLVILLAIFFFEPVVKKMNNYLEEIEKQNKKIQASEAEIRQIAEKRLEANEQLLLAQKQMQEKNAELEKAKQATEKLLKEQEEANKKLALVQRELQKTLAEQNRTNQKLVEAQQELLQKAQELEKSEREMRALAEAQFEANEQLFVAQRKMQEAQKELQRLSLVASKTDNIVIISDANGLIEWVNEGFERLTEYKLEEVKGKKPGAFLQGVETNPADVQTIREGLANRKPFYAEIYNYSKSGKGYWLGLNITPIFDENGSLTQFIAIETDITERKKAEQEIKELLEMQTAINDTLMLAQQEAAQKAQELERSEKEVRALAEAQLEANEQLFVAQRKMEESQRELQIATERLNLAIAGTNDGIWDWDIANNKVYFSSRWKSMLGYEDSELENSFEVFASLQHPEDAPIVRERLENYLSGKTEVYSVELRMKTKSGDYRWILARGIALRDAEGKPYRMAGSHTDITERKRAEQEIKELLEMQTAINDALMLAQQEAAQKSQELERSEREMRALAEAQLEANEQLFMAQRKEKERLDKLEKYSAILRRLSLTPYENYGSLKNAYHAITEFLAEGLNVERASVWKYTGGSIISEDLFEKSKSEHSEGVELFAKDFPAYFEGVSSGLSILAENAHTHPNTFEFSEVYLSPLGINSMLDVPIRVDGKLSGVICCEHVGKDFRKWSQEDEAFVRSISDIVSLYIEAEKRIRAQEEIKELLEMQTAINDTLMLAQQEAAQKAQELERSEREMRALAEAQLEANEKLMLAEKKLKETLELEQKQRAELDRLVAQLKETQGQLVHNEKMASLGQLTAGIAHEINNPINFVYNGIDTLKVSLDDLMEIVNKYNELDNANGNKDAVIEEAKRLKQQLDFEELTQDIEHLVADIKRGAVRTMEIVKGLRVFSRLDEEERKMASIKDCLDSTLILLNSKMKGRIELKKYYDESMPDIMCYPGQLNQVFMNIINNAIQAIPEDRKDGEISIYTENQQENVIIRIKDNGIGMSEQVKRRIFEPFFTTKPVGVGTGLGLSITFGIIEKHGGNIFVNSEEGKGTEFVIQLPKEKI